MGRRLKTCGYDGRDKHCRYDGTCNVRLLTTDY